MMAKQGHTGGTRLRSKVLLTTGIRGCAAPPQPPKRQACLVAANLLSRTSRVRLKIAGVYRVLCSSSASHASKEACRGGKHSELREREETGDRPLET